MAKQSTLLSRVVKGQSIGPFVGIFYGPPGVGKTTFGSTAPNPVFLQTEDGANVVGADRLPVAGSYDETIEYLDALINEEHSYNTLVIDSLDHLEPHIETKVLTTHKTDKGQYVERINDYGFGNGQGYMKDYWRDFFARIFELRAKRTMQTILIAHSEQKKHNVPDLPDPYDRWTLKLMKCSTELCVEYSDIIGFCTYETVTRKVDTGFGGVTVKGHTTGKRLLKLHDNAAFLAKSRYPVPAEIPLSYPDLHNHVYTAKDASNGGN